MTTRTGSRPQALRPTMNIILHSTSRRQPDSKAMADNPSRPHTRPCFCAFSQHAPPGLRHRGTRSCIEGTSPGLFHLCHGTSRCAESDPALCQTRLRTMGSAPGPLCQMPPDAAPAGHETSIAMLDRNHVGRSYMTGTRTARSRRQTLHRWLRIGVGTSSTMTSNNLSLAMPA
jgi:hypothetical protein